MRLNRIAILRVQVDPVALVVTDRVAGDGKITRGTAGSVYIQPIAAIIRNGVAADAPTQISGSIHHITVDPLTAVV